MPYTPPPLGIGFAYSSVLEPILLERLLEGEDLVGLVEVEPQTLWAPADGDGSGYRVDTATLDRITGYGLPVLLHGVGNPVGGCLGPDPAQAALFADVAATVGAPWVSEHLSLNRAATPDGTLFSGFLLPPLATPAGAERAAASVRALAGCAGRPLAVETGVSYLRRRPGELTDGAFVAAVAEAADCGILLDLHNVWTNERNGRQPVAEFLAEIPLDRVWEIHLAGGSERDGFWLDSHNGGVPEPLVDLVSRLLPDLPALGAIVFELLPANLPSLGMEGVRRELEQLSRLWRGRRRRRGSWAFPPIARADAPLRQGPLAWPGGPPDPPAWEQALVRAVLARAPRDPLEASLSGEPGVALIRRLVGRFRRAMVEQNLKLTTRLLLLTVGEEGLQDLLAGHWSVSAPAPFAVTEADAFAAYLAASAPDVPYLRDVLGFERATLATLIDDRHRVVGFAHDPLTLLRALAAGRLPERSLPGSFEVEVTPDEVPEGWTIEEAASPAAAWHH